MSGLSPRARALIEQARPAEEPSAEDRARMDRRLVALLAGATVTTAAGTGAAASGGAKLLSGAAVKTMLAALLVGGGVGVTAMVARTTLQRDPTVVVSAEPRSSRPSWASGPAPVAPRASVAPSAAASAAPSAPADEALPSPAPSATTRRLVAPPSGSTLLDEAAVLQRAQEAMREDDPDRALAALDEHERRFGDGTLRQEREAARAIAWCRAGRTAEGRRAAASFLAEHPTSPLASRVRDACPKP